MTHARTHSGHATAARRRGEQMVGCATCGQYPCRNRPRFQAGPRELEPAIPPVRLLNILLSMVFFWMVTIALVVSKFGDDIRRIFGGVA